uniref:Cyclin E1 n=1 Tax=Mus musculus TaxID=10090 RepID=A0A0U1RNE6_MOUSE
MPRERDSTDHSNMKEEGGSDLSVRSRKRKANVAVVSTKDTGWEGDSPPPLPSYLGTKFGSSYLLVKRIS